RLADNAEIAVRDGAGTGKHDITIRINDGVGRIDAAVEIHGQRTEVDDVTSAAADVDGVSGGKARIAGDGKTDVAAVGNPAIGIECKRIGCQCSKQQRVAALVNR